MQYDCLQLYQRAQSAPLQAQEVNWLTQQVSDFPYFALPHLILARHYSLDRSGLAQQQLLTSSTYSVNRSLMQDYMLAPVLEQEDENEAESLPIDSASTESTISTTAVAGLVAGAATTVVAATSNLQEEGTSPDEQEAAEAESTSEVNWYLNTQVKLRGARYRGLEANLKGQMKSFAEQSAKEDQGKRNQIEQEEVTFARTPVKPKFDRPKAKVEAEEETQASRNYEIGAFSSFSFVEDQEVAAPEEKEMDSTIAPPTSVAFQAPPNPGIGISELIFEEGDRILEITVTAEELEKYFKGQLPQSFNRGFSATRLEFDFHSTATGELADANWESLDEAPASLEADITLEKEAAVAPVEQKEVLEEKIIDRFIENDPSISRIDAYKGNKDDLSRKSSVENDEWVTETLANIYAMQGNNAKAIRIYKKLSLIFPEKSSYFDDQIAKLKK